MKKVFVSVLLSFVFVFSVFAADPDCSGYPAAFTDSDSDGFYDIDSCVKLQCMNTSKSRDYELVQDIDCSDTKNWRSGKGFFVSSGAFSGDFKGNGFKISGLFIFSPGQNFVGLFNYVNNNIITNLRLENVNITGNHHVGGLSGADGTTGSVIINCSVSGYVRGKESVGGLVGYIGHSGVSSSSSSAVVYGNSSVGGLIGDFWGGSINNSFASGSVFGCAHSSYDDSCTFVGGLVGFSIGSYTPGVDYIQNSYASGDVVGNDAVGGFAGFLDDITVQNSFSTGKVSYLTFPEAFWRSSGFIGVAGPESVISGIVWNNVSLNPSFCYTGFEFVGEDILFTESNVGCSAVQNNNAYFYSKNNAPMSSWDFVSVWKQNTNKYPSLISGSLCIPSVEIWDGSEGIVQDCDTVVEVWANYTNYTSGDFISGAVCNLTFSDAPGTVYVMVEGGDGSTVLYYNNSKSFASAGTYNFTVICSHPDFSEVYATDNITISGVTCDFGPGGPSVPEFSLGSAVVAVVVVIVGMALLMLAKRKREF